MSESTKSKSSRIGKTALSIALVMLSGLLLSICFPGMGGTGELVWIWALPFFYAIFQIKGKKRGRKALALGYLCGFTFWMLNLKWLFATRELDFVPTFNAALAWIALPAYLASYFAIFAFVIVKWANPFDEVISVKPTNRIDAKIAAKQSEQNDQKANSGGKLALSFKQSKASLRLALFHASLWAILEWVRSWMISGFSWNGLGAAFYDTPVLAQSAELVGVVALSFLPMFVGSVLFQVARRMVLEAAEGKLKPHWDLCAAGLLVALLFGFGVLRLNQLNKAPSKEVNFLIVQQNLPLDQKHNEGSHIGNMMDCLDMTTEGIEKIKQLNKQNYLEGKKQSEEVAYTFEQADIVLWPESTLLHGIIFTEDTEEAGLTEIESHAVLGATQLGNHYLVSGANEFHFQSLEDYQYGRLSKSYNSIGLYKANGEDMQMIDTYQKNHLVMFGEYIPLRDTFPFLEKLMGGPMGPNFLPGGSYEPLVIEHKGEPLELIGSVCFEDTVGSLTRKSVRSAHQIIINTTNDGWFGKSAESEQHLANALFRCIELRRPMARAANTGISCIINVKGSYTNADGSLNAITDENGSHFTDGTLYAKARVLTDGPLTLYAIAGDWFIIVCGLIFLITGLISVKLGRS